MNPRKGARLYAPDLDAIHGLARAGFLLADQLRRHFYPQSSERTTTNRLAQLAREDFQPHRLFSPLDPTEHRPPDLRLLLDTAQSYPTQNLPRRLRSGLRSPRQNYLYLNAGVARRNGR